MSSTKTHQVATRYAEDEYQLIEAAAALNGLKFGPYVRALAVSAARSTLLPLAERTQ